VHGPIRLLDEVSVGEGQVGVPDHVRDESSGEEAVVSKGVGVLAGDFGEANLGPRGGLGEGCAQPAIREEVGDRLRGVLDAGLFGGGGEADNEITRLGPLGVESGDGVSGAGRVDLPGDLFWVWLGAGGDLLVLGELHDPLLLDGVSATGGAVWGGRAGGRGSSSGIGVGSWGLALTASHIPRLLRVEILIVHIVSARARSRDPGAKGSIVVDTREGREGEGGRLLSGEGAGANRGWSEGSRWLNDFNLGTRSARREATEASIAYPVV